MSTSEAALSLYRSMLRTASQFTSYNFRVYAIRRTKDAFRESKFETDERRIQELLNKAEVQLGMLKRQTAISKMYTFDKLVVETQAPAKFLHKESLEKVVAK